MNEELSQKELTAGMPKAIGVGPSQLAAPAGGGAFNGGQVVATGPLNVYHQA